VIGIGVNVRLDGAQRARIDQPTVDLLEAGAPPRSRNDWLAKLLLELATTLHAFAAGGFGERRNEWCRYSAHHDRRVRLTLPDGRQIEGVAKGVDDEGRLLVEAGGRSAAYLSADVSLRGVDDSRG
jgi:BirA family biotin operon repressor/biotin-[acetyl-CoA-carboxylase] ligase